MPEGDTLVWTASRLDAALLGKTLTRSDLRVPRWATTDLSGREVLPSVTYGKHLFQRFAGGITLHSHLKMEGRWSVLTPSHAVPARESDRRRRADGEIRRAEKSHTSRALLYVPDALAVGSKLGVLDVIPTAEEVLVTGALGPDLLADGWETAGREDAMRRLRSRPDRPLGEALLDQRNLAGLGTFWISEMLFLHRVSPWQTVGATADEVLSVVLSEARRLMLDSAGTGVQSSTGRCVGETKRVHARSGLPCLRCHDTIRVALTTERGRERTLFTCPTCQGGRAPTDDGRPQRPLVERPRS